MDLRNLSSPNQLDSVIQRRPSLSSLSSTSGYDLSTYGNSGTVPATNAGSTPQMAQLRMSTGNRLYSGMLSNSSSTNLATMAPAVASDVGPWVEQQKQQQSLNMTLDKKDKVPPSPSMGGTLLSNTTLDDDDELIPTAIVIKNIPFAIKKEQLLDVMTKLNLPLPYAFNYHFDNGVFRGLAFANFTLTEETSMVVSHLNGREIGGRKLRVEYKKMLPLQERERIEREKREKRGQLEEQHRSTSNASLASLLSTASTTAATKNLSVNGQQFNTQTERLFVQFPSAAPAPPAELNFNDPEVLDLYSQLLTYRDDNSKLIFELAFSSQMPMHQRKVLSLLCTFLNLLELFDNGLIIIRRKPGQQSIQQRQQQSASFTAHAPQAQQPQTPTGVQPLHSSSMMNLTQLPMLGTYGGMPQQPHAPELLRLHSQSALPLPRLRQQASTPVQQYAQYQPQQKPQSAKYQNYGYGASSSNQNAALGTPASSSAAALLRSSNNRSYVDVRANSGFPSASATGSPTPQHATAYFQSSQPGTPLGTGELNSRFAPFGQHANLGGSLTSLQPASATSDEFPINDPLTSKFGALHVNGYEPKAGIWAKK